MTNVKVGGSVSCETKAPIQSLYIQLLQCWNDRNAPLLASLCADKALIIGFDGTQHCGKETIARELSVIFTQHATPAFVACIKSICLLSPTTALLHAVAGMIPDGQSQINPDLNAIQIMVATSQQGIWHIVSFQNTPAQFHGRPDLTEALTQELRQLL